MGLDLVHGRNDASRRDDLFKLVDCEVGDTDRADLFGLFRDPDELGPGLGDAWAVCVDIEIPLGSLGEEVRAGGEGDWPVNQVDVEV